MAKGKLIREVECAVCPIPPAERYDRRLAQRRTGGQSSERELRGGDDKRSRRYPLCPGFLRLAFLKIFYPFFKTPYAGIFIILGLCGAVLIGGVVHFKYLWQNDTPAPAAATAAEETDQKNFINFARTLQREFAGHSRKNKYSIQIVITVNKIIDGFLEKYPAIPEAVPGEIIDSMFLDSFNFYFNGANVLFENYFYVADDQLDQLIRRLEMLLRDTENLFSDWEKVDSRLPRHANSHIHAVYVRKIKNLLALFKSNIRKLKSGNIIKEPLVIPALDIKKLPTNTVTK
ncbi:MAG: hypothetical protein U9O97_01810 [Elusimicrobiota bacterium]|nr:hypothetical protein [Elusimicrobiota bacterium]